MTIDAGTVTLRGDLVISTIESLSWAAAAQSGATTINLDAVGRFDTAGAWAVVELDRALSPQGRKATLAGATDLQAELLATIRDNMPDDGAPAAPRRTIAELLDTFGRRTAHSFGQAIAITGFLGQVVSTIAYLALHPRQVRWTAMFYHMQQVGLSAVPIVSLMAFLIGVVLAFQGAAQLRQFGAEVFVVDLIAISILRELGILLTAIIVAGRSGSAFTAAIGSMKMREEIDAMRTLGLDPVTILVVPRTLALIFMLPVLGVIANAAGLFGGALMSWIELGVSPGVFQIRFATNTDVWHFGVGMIKAPFFALIIGIIGCYQGMQVEGNAESLGRLTSLSVVLSIFLVITADALFSIFFAIVGV
ncbi:MlaE family lipid ABC transporter permease subunit [Yoonia sp.]|uniref:ABC transporter permease n=1 Tax=Yoonia sp. TaxID=2212373 RepID=UPI0019F30E35|nr:MlaE family lipid ABC transporter permease subunit [Yoonia sp.]MBE0412986.1 MlaE family lipid ABC transporter permease subunit [Yoonia sp.]